jgi:hypothetical protein
MAGEADRVGGGPLEHRVDLSVARGKTNFAGRQLHRRKVTGTGAGCKLCCDSGGRGYSYSMTESVFFGGSPRRVWFSSFLFAPCSPQSDPYAFVIYAEGFNMSIYRNDTLENYDVLVDDVIGMPLLPGDLVQTDAGTFVELQVMPSRTVVKVAENTTFEIESLRRRGGRDVQHELRPGPRPGGSGLRATKPSRFGDSPPSRGCAVPILAMTWSSSGTPQTSFRPTSTSSRVRWKYPRRPPLPAPPRQTPAIRRRETGRPTEPRPKTARRNRSG